MYALSCGVKYVIVASSIYEKSCCAVHCKYCACLYPYWVHIQRLPGKLKLFAYCARRCTLSLGFYLAACGAVAPCNCYRPQPHRAWDCSVGEVRRSPGAAGNGPGTDPRCPGTGPVRSGMGPYCRGTGRAAWGRACRDHIQSADQHRHCACTKRVQM